MQNKRQLMPFFSALGFPKKKRLTLKFVQTWASPVCLGGQQDHTKIVFACNGLHVPGSSGTQPYGWDQIKARYGKYMVIGAKIRFKEVNSDSNVDKGTGVYYLDIHYVGSDLLVRGDYRAQQMLERNVINFEDMRSTTQHVGGSAQTISNKGHITGMELTKTWRLSDWRKSLLVEYTADNLWLSTGSNPSGINEPQFFFSFNIDNATSSAPATQIAKHFIVEVEYDVLLREPIAVPSS